MRHLLTAIIALALFGCSVPDSTTIDIPDSKDDLDLINARLDAIETLDQLQNTRLDALETRVGLLEAQDILFDRLIDEMSQSFMDDLLRVEGLTEQNKVDLELFTAQVMQEVQNLQSYIADETLARETSEEEIRGLIDDNSSLIEQMGLRVDNIEYCLNDIDRHHGMPRLFDGHPRNIDCHFTMSLASRLSSLDMQLWSTNWRIDNLRDDMRNLNRQINRLTRNFSRDIRAINTRITINSMSIAASFMYLNSQIKQRTKFLKGLIDRNTIDIADNAADIQVNIDNIAGNTAAIGILQDEMEGMQDRMATAENDIETLAQDQFAVVDPCPTSDNKEILIQTPDGLMGYFQVERNISINSANNVTTIPAHEVCTAWSTVSTNYPWWYDYDDHTTTCTQTKIIPTSTAVDFVTKNIKEISQSYLTILPDGNYRTTDGYMCNFSIVNGQLATD